MKIFFLLSLFSVSALTSFEAFAKEARDLSEPPFIMSSYDEFSDLQKEQKETYLQGLILNFKSVPSLKEYDATKLDEASEWNESWDLIRKSVYNYCDDNGTMKVCAELADLRVKTLETYALKPFDRDK